LSADALQRYQHQHVAADVSAILSERLGRRMKAHAVIGVSRMADARLTAAEVLARRGPV
jgi:hypothetical protein